MLIAQITDMHVKAEGELLFKRIDTAAYLERAVSHLLKLDPRPDIVLATGDLVEAGKPEEYARLRRLLAPLAMPVYLIPGNHDARDTLRAAFPDHAYLPSDGFIQYAIEELPLRLIALDTLVPGQGHGELCDQRLDWLEATLAEGRDRPTLVFMHHPPFECGIGCFDSSRLLKGDRRLAELVQRHGNVQRVMCGHVHRPIQVLFGGTMGSIGPSTAHQATLDLHDDARYSMMMEPPAIAIHQWRPGTGLVTHVSYIGEFDGPKPFRAL